MSTLLENLAVTEVLLIVFLLSIGFAAGSFSTSNTLQSMDQDPSYSLSCPEPVINKKIIKEDKKELRTVKKSQSFIQNPGTDVSYENSDNGVKIKIDAISKPEGMSMRPTIFTGNTVLLDKYEGGELSSGQIIRYESEEGGYIIHRIRANYLDTEGYLLVKGDNTNSSERVGKEKVTHLVEGVLYT